MKHDVVISGRHTSGELPGVRTLTPGGGLTVRLTAGAGELMSPDLLSFPPITCIAHKRLESKKPHIPAANSK